MPRRPHTSQVTFSRLCTHPPMQDQGPDNDQLLGEIMHKTPHWSAPFTRITQPMPQQGSPEKRGTRQTYSMHASSCMDKHRPQRQRFSHRRYGAAPRVLRVAAIAHACDGTSRSIPTSASVADAVGLMSACLSWGFQRRHGTASGFLTSEVSATPRNPATNADPSADLVASRAPDYWLATVLAPPLRQWLVAAQRSHASAAAAARGGPAAAELAARLRQVLLQMCLLAPWESRGGGSMEVAELGVRGLIEVRTPDTLQRTPALACISHASRMHALILRDRCFTLVCEGHGRLRCSSGVCVRASRAMSSAPDMSAATFVPLCV